MNVTMHFKWLSSLQRWCADLAFSSGIGGFPRRQFCPAIVSPRLCIKRHISKEQYVCKLPWSEILPYRNVRVNLTEAVKSGWALKGVDDFSEKLISDVAHWRSEGRSAVWLHIPISQGSLIPAASELGFQLHHGKGEEVVMNLWLLRNKPSRLPHYATHQVGACGVVYREDTGEMLVTQDKYKFSKWKFPGGISNHGEDIAATVVREVKEETGVDTEFLSILAFRQQHKLPNNFNCSDLYFICRMRPLSFDLHPCEDEVLKCQWMHIDELLGSEEATHLTKSVLGVLKQGLDRGPHVVDISMEEWPSIDGKSTYKLFLRSKFP